MASFGSAAKRLCTTCSGDRPFNTRWRLLVIGLVEALEQRLQIPVAVDRNAQHLALHPPVEALHETVGLRRVGLGSSMLHLQLAAGVLEAVGGEAGSSVRQDMRDLEGEGAHRLVQEGDRACGQLVVFDRQVHPARTTVDGDIQEALAALAIGGPQLGQVLDVDVDEAEIVVLERAALPLVLLRRRQTAEPLSLEDAVDRIAVEMRQEVRDDEGEIVERKAGGRRRAQTMARSSSVAFQGSLCGRLLWSWQSCAPRLRHLRTVSVLTLKRCASTPVGSRRAGDLLANRRGGAGLRMKGVHHVLLRRGARRRRPSKRQAYSSIAQRT